MSRLSKCLAWSAALVVAVLSSATSAQTYTNSAQIFIEDFNTAPYPSIIDVTGAPTSITDIRVTLNSISHTFASDVRVLLVAPNGAAIKLFDLAFGNGNNFTNMSVAFASDASAAFPAIPASGVYVPTGGSFVLPIPAPQTAGASSFAPVIGANPNGTWRLFVYDNAGTDTGTIAGGWTIQFYERNYALQGFTYQGRLDGAQPGDAVSLRFTAYDSLVSTGPLDLVAGPVTALTTVADDGTVTVPVNFNTILPTDRQVFMQVEVALAGQTFVALSPRQPVAPAPLAFKSIEAVHALVADAANTANNANLANSANSANFAVNATNADHALNADNAADAASLGGVVATAYARRDTPNILSADQTIATANMLSFGTIGNGTNTAEGSDLIAFRRFSSSNNFSDLRLTIGDDPVANTDGFTIGYTSNGTNFTEVFRFQSNGIATKPGGGAWTAPSDRRLKHDIMPLEGSLDRLLGLRGVSFAYNDPKRAGACEGTMMGFIAQDVEPLFPRWVSTDAEGYKAITITGFEALTVEALRELRKEKDAQIAEKDEQIAELREQVQDLYQRLERLETQAK